MARTREEHPLSPVCLCQTPAYLLCPEHEQDTGGLRSGAYETLAMMYLNAYKFSELRAKDSERLNFVQDCGCQWTEKQMRVAFAFPVGLSLREGIDAAMARGSED